MSGGCLPVLKILVVGPSGAGKSSLLLRYCEDQYDPDSTAATIGIDFKSRNLVVHGKAYKVNMFDTAGQERFRTLSTSFYRGAQGVILVYDISNRGTFLGMAKWFDEAKSNALPGAILYLVGSKLDRSNSRAVSVEEGRALAEVNDAHFCELSSKSRQNVRKPFVEIVDQIVQQPHLISMNDARANADHVILGLPSDYTSACPC